MRTIYKYPLRLADRQFVAMPCDAEILSVQVQGQDICLWAIVSPDAKMEVRYFHIVGTGHEMPECRTSFVGTVQLGSFVGHVFSEVA